MTKKGICTPMCVAVWFSVAKVWKQLVSVKRWMDKDVRFTYTFGFPRGKESTCQRRKWGFNSWVGKIPWSRKWQPTPVFLLGKFHGQRSLVGYSPWGCKESELTEHTHTSRWKRCIWKVSGKERCRTSMPSKGRSLSPNLLVFTYPEVLWIQSLWVFMEVLLYRHNWLNGLWQLI